LWRGRASEEEGEREEGGGEEEEFFDQYKNDLKRHAHTLSGRNVSIGEDCEFFVCGGEQ